MRKRVFQDEFRMIQSLASFKRKASMKERLNSGKWGALAARSFKKISYRSLIQRLQKMHPDLLLMSLECNLGFTL